ncbi:G-type lectin S-receptor-like serine/threonine-protein kinase [Tanacetum coccineum]|uniref:G-type lectin S-receptor-like serine/threonine-protein kinase n=1 Tax=Tanacetum coccineum TaxID=301880 RepID=A0ABQ5HMH7_9ASTR
MEIQSRLFGREWRLSSWKTSQDPSPSDITWSVDTNGYPQYLLREGATVRFRAGPWNGERFSGASRLTKNNIFTYHVIINETKVSYTYNLENSFVLSRLTINSYGILERLVWVEDGKRWQLHLALPKDICDTYNIYGTYGSCSISNSHTCSCLDEKRFVPRNQKGWDMDDWSGGCFLWFADLLDIRYPPGNSDQDIFVRMASSDIDNAVANRKEERTNIKFILTGIFLAILLISLSTWLWYAWRRKHHSQPIEEGGSLNAHESQREAIELPLFSFFTIANATANFLLEYGSWISTYTTRNVFDNWGHTH